MKIDVEKLRAARCARGMSQEEVAAAAGISSRTLQRVERNQEASFETARALAALFEQFGIDIRLQPDSVREAPTDQPVPIMIEPKTLADRAKWSAKGIVLGGLCSLIGIVAGFAQGGMSWGQLGLALALLGFGMGIAFEFLAFLNHLPYRRGSKPHETT